MNTQEAFEWLSCKATQLGWDLMSNYPNLYLSENLDKRNRELVENVFKALCSLRNSIEDQLIVAEKTRENEINEEEDFSSKTGWIDGDLDE